MTDNRQQPTSYIKYPVPTAPATTPAATNSKFSKKKPVMIFGVDARKFAAVAGLGLFFMVALLGVGIALRQRFVQGPAAPTAPESRPQADVVRVATCTISFDIGTTNVDCGDPCGGNSGNQCPNGHTCSPTSNTCVLDACLLPGATCSTDNCNVVTPTPTPTPTPPPLDCGDGCGAGTSGTCPDNHTCSPTSNTCVLNTCLQTGVTCNTNNCAVVTTPTPTPTFACDSTCTTDAQCETVNANYFCSTGGRCRLRSNESSTTCQPAAATYACNSACTADSQCQTANAEYICSSDHGNTCRLNSNRPATNCQPQPLTYSCNSTCDTNAQCQTASSSYICFENHCRLDSNPSATSCQPAVIVQPTPTIGCNDPCTTNSDCTSIDHICYTTPSGAQRCRLPDYVNSETCTAPRVVYTPAVVSTPTPQGVQPQLPQELPQTGFTDVAKWLVGGLIVIGAGAVLLLLL